MNFDIDYFDYSVRVLPLNYPTFYKKEFMARVKYIDDYQKFKETDWPLLFDDYIFLRMKFNNKIFKFFIYNTTICQRFEIERLDVRFYSKTDVFLIFYDPTKENHYSFEYDLSFKNAKKFYNDAYNYNKNALFCLIRINYRDKYDLSSKVFVSEEEALEFAHENNLLYFHISIDEKYDSGLNQLFYYILKELCLKYNLLDKKKFERIMLKPQFTR